MRLDDFDFEPPRRLIADRPCELRDAARLLVIPASGGLQDLRVADLPALLRPGDLLVFNDTKVIPARLLGDLGPMFAAHTCSVHQQVSRRRCQS